MMAILSSCPLGLVEVADFVRRGADWWLDATQPERNRFMKIRYALICAALALAPACSKSGPDALMDKMVGIMEEMGTAVDSAGGDCGKMAAALDAVTTKHESELKDIKAQAEKMKGDKAQSEELMKKYGPRIEKVMPKMMGMMKCSDDPKMKEVQKKLDGMM
jgi:hypothetical protein